MTDALKPCPFCGSADLYATSNGHESHSVGCNFCGTEGPAAPTDSTARDVWNDRAALAQPSVEPVAYWISKAEQFSIAKQGERPFAKAWQPLYAAPQPAPDQAEQAQALAAAFSRGHDAGWQSATAHHVAKQPARVPLTDGEIEQIADGIPVDDFVGPTTWHLKLARAVEAAHGIKEKT